MRKTNKEKALELINRNKVPMSMPFEDKVTMVSSIIAETAVNQATMQDWYYIDKNELPNNCEVVYCVYGEYNRTCEGEYDADTGDFYESDHNMSRTDSTITEVKAWTRLPQFIKEQS